MNKPRFRITIELLDLPECRGNDNYRFSGLAFDTGRILGDVWFHAETRRHSFDVESLAFFFGVGSPADNFRSASEAIDYARKSARFSK